MATLLLAEHDNKTLKDATAKALTAAKAIGGKAEFITVVEKYGNTSSASVGLALHDSWDRFHKGDLILLVAFGGGLSWAGALLEW